MICYSHPVKKGGYIDRASGGVPQDSTGLMIWIHNREWSDAIDEFIVNMEVLVAPAGEDERVAAALPGLICPSCGGLIAMTLEEPGLFWLTDGGQGVDLNEPFIQYLTQRLRSSHPDWQIRSFCKLCNEELTFP